MYLPADEAGPSTSGQEQVIEEEGRQPQPEEPQVVKPQFILPTSPPPPQPAVELQPPQPAAGPQPNSHSSHHEHLQVPRRIKSSPVEQPEPEEQPGEHGEAQPEPAKPDPAAAVKKTPVPFIGPDKFLHLDRNFQALRHPQITGNSLRIQHRLIGQLEAIIRKNPQNGSKDPKPSKEELKKMLTEMTKKLLMLEVATSAGRAVSSQQGYEVFSIMGKSRPPEEKPLIPPRRLQFGRKKGIGIDGIGGGSSVLSPKPEMDKTPKRTPVVPIRKPLNQPPLIQTPIPFYPDTNSPPLDNHYDLSDLPNGNENNLHDDTPITPPLALNKGKRKAASGMGILPLSTQINSIGEKAEKRPKRVEGQLKKRTSNRLSKPRVTAKEEEEPTYCFCSRVSFGEMVGCDNDKCEIEWFHFECIGLTSKPKGKWFCPNCRHPDSAKMPKTAPLPKIIKELKREMLVPEM